MKLNDLRLDINKIDEKIIELLEKRFEITNEIGDFKLLNNLKLYNKERVDEIISKIENTDIKKIYKKILHTSTNNQFKKNIKAGLIGMDISHSISDKIHKNIADNHGYNIKYDLIDIKVQDLEKYINMLKTYDYMYFNITMPYKKEVIKYIDKISQNAAEIGAVNFVYYDGYNICGDNTDYYGAYNTLKKIINILEKNKVLIIGNGQTCQTFKQALKNLNINYEVYARNPILLDEKNLSDISKNKKNYILINTTPVGMYPDVDSMVVGIDICKNANYIYDVIYNPLQTKILQYAKSGNNGYEMLVIQAEKSFEIALGLDNEN